MTRPQTPTGPPVYRTPQARCPTCGATLDCRRRVSGTGAMDPAAGEPRPGDITVCIPCGELLYFDVEQWNPQLQLSVLIGTDDALEAIRRVFLARERAHPMLYRLDPQGQPVPEPDINVWLRWMVGADHDGSRRVARETRRIQGEENLVSTVFLGVDAASGRGGGHHAPRLWETMLFWPGHPDHLACQRYRSRAAAEAGHRQWVARLFRTAPAEESLEAFAARVERLAAEIEAREEETYGDPRAHTDPA